MPSLNRLTIDQLNNLTIVELDEMIIDSSSSSYSFGTPITIINTALPSNNIDSMILGINVRLGTSLIKQSDIINLRVISLIGYDEDRVLVTNDSNSIINDDTSNNGVSVRFAGQKTITSKTII